MSYAGVPVMPSGSMLPHGRPLSGCGVPSPVFQRTCAGARVQTEDPIALGGGDQGAAHDEGLAVHRVAEALAPGVLQRRPDRVGRVTRPRRRAVVGPPGRERRGSTGPGVVAGEDSGVVRLTVSDDDAGPVAGVLEAVEHAATSRAETDTTIVIRRRMGSAPPPGTRVTSRSRGTDASVRPRVVIPPPAGHTLVTPRMFGVPGRVPVGSRRRHPRFVADVCPAA